MRITSTILCVVTMFSLLACHGISEKKGSVTSLNKEKYNDEQSTCNAVQKRAQMKIDRACAHSNQLHDKEIGSCSCSSDEDSRGREKWTCEVDWIAWCNLDTEPEKKTPRPQKRSFWDL